MENNEVRKTGSGGKRCNFCRERLAEMRELSIKISKGKALDRGISNCEGSEAGPCMGCSRKLEDWSEVNEVWDETG